MEKPRQKKNSGKKRGGQPGHKGHSRFLYEPEDCTVLDHHPETCICCGEKLTGVDASLYRHQVVFNAARLFKCNGRGTRTGCKIWRLPPAVRGAQSPSCYNYWTCRT